MISMTLDDGPSTSRIFTRARPSGVVFYVEVVDLGVLVVPAESNPRDPRGKLYPQTSKLLSRRVLDRLERSQTPLPQVRLDPPSPSSLGDDDAPR